MLGWLLVSHVMLWFFIMWFARLLVLLFLKKNSEQGLFWQAVIMGLFSLLFHYALHKVAGVPLIL